MQDLARLRAQAQALLEIRIIQARGTAHRAVLERGWIDPDLHPDSAALDRDLSDATVSAVLVSDVRSGRLTATQARAFLNDYALAMAMSDGQQVRDAMLDRLGAVSAEIALRERVLEALDAHARDAARLAADAASSADLLAQWTESPAWLKPEHAPGARDAWSALILDRISDPAQRDAATELLELLLPAQP